MHSQSLCSIGQNIILRFVPKLRIIKKFTFLELNTHFYLVVVTTGNVNENVAPEPFLLFLPKIDPP